MRVVLDSNIRLSELLSPLSFPRCNVGTPPETLRRLGQNKEKTMARSRYVITEPDKPHFLTCTVMEWLPVFTRPATVQIVLGSWAYLRETDGLKLYGYVILENHLHFVAQSPHLDKSVMRFKSYTAKRIIEHLESRNAEVILQRLRFSKRAHKTDRRYQFWQEGSHAELLWNDALMREKLDYIHANPVKRGYVDKAEHWRYSSARNYAGESGLIGVDAWH